MDGRAGDGSYGEDEAAEPHGTSDPGGRFDVVPAETAGDDAGDKGSLVHYSAWSRLLDYAGLTNRDSGSVHLCQLAVDVGLYQLFLSV